MCVSSLLRRNKPDPHVPPMSDEIVVFATVVAKSDHVREVHDVLTTLLELSRKEDGCCNYDLHRDIQDSSVFILHETWESATHVDAHNLTPHFETAVSMLQDITESVAVKRTKMI